MESYKFLRKSWQRALRRRNETRDDRRGSRIWYSFHCPEVFVSAVQANLILRFRWRLSQNDWRRARDGQTSLEMKQLSRIVRNTAEC